MRKHLLYFVFFMVFSHIVENVAFADETVPVHKVLVVMSYEDDYPWVIEVKEGVDSIFAGNAEIRYFYMNAKKDLEGSKAKGKEAYELYQTYRPDGVIAMDDNAQQDFVLPYLKDKVKTPILFGGVNEEPEVYGYPTPHISGILDRFHIAESIAMAQQLVPTIRTVGFLMKDEPTTRYLAKQIESEKANYSATVQDIKFPKSFKEAMEMTEELKKNCDLLFVAILQGLPDEGGNPISERQGVQTVAKAFGGPTITNLEANVKNGALCAVVKTGQEQGAVAAQMLLDALKGKLVSEMPVVRNRHGKRIINVTVMQQMGIKPNSLTLRGSQLVKSAD